MYVYVCVHTFLRFLGMYFVFIYDFNYVGLGKILIQQTDGNQMKFIYFMHEKLEFI
jgi:hypothetical protein